jgi:predicted permease
VSVDRTATLEKVVDRFAEWVRFGDAKAGGVLVILGLGLADLLDHAARLTAAHDLHSKWGDLATVLFWTALILAGIAVVTVSRALFPRVKATTDSEFFFGTVANYGSGGAYRDAVARLTPEQIEGQLAEQAWELARIADRKYRHTREAYFIALLFLLAWAIARSTLSIAD